MSADLGSLNSHGRADSKLGHVSEGHVLAGARGPSTALRMTFLWVYEFMGSRALEGFEFVQRARPVGTK